MEQKPTRKAAHAFVESVGDVAACRSDRVGVVVVIELLEHVAAEDSDRRPARDCWVVLSRAVVLCPAGRAGNPRSIVNLLRRCGRTGGLFCCWLM